MTLSSRISKIASPNLASNYVKFLGTFYSFINLDHQVVKCLAKLDSVTIEDMCNIPNIALLFFLTFCIVIKHCFIILSDHILLVLPPLIFSDNIFSEISKDSLVSKTSNQNQMQDTFWSPAK